MSTKENIEIALRRRSHEGRRGYADGVRDTLKALRQWAKAATDAIPESPMKPAMATPWETLDSHLVKSLKALETIYPGERASDDDCGS